MDQTEHLLTCLNEECVEVAQAVTKSLRFGLDDQYADRPVNSRHLQDELTDLMAIIELLRERGILPKEFDRDAIELKRHKVLKFMGYAQQRGTLT